VLYRTGAEEKIRKYLIDNNYVDTVIQLPPNLFFGVNIATCVIVLKKSKNDNSVLFIDASAEFVHAGTKNKLSADHQKKILDAFTSREDVEHFAKLVAGSAIAVNKYNLSIQRYVEGQDLHEVVNIEELNSKIAAVVAEQSELREQIVALVADLGAIS
jgi:type I restriction enzyme M protein